MRFSTEEHKREIRLLADVWGISKRYHAVLLCTMIMQIVLGLFPASLTFYIQHLFSDSSHLSELLSTSHLLAIIGMLFFVILLKQGCALLQGTAVANVKLCIEKHYVDGLAKSDYSHVRDDMTNRNVVAVSRESDMLTALVPMFYQSFIQAPCTILAFCALMLFVSARLTAIIVLLILAVITCSFLLRRTVKRLSKTLFERFSDLHQVFVEWLNGYRVFLLYDALPLMKERLTAIVSDTCGLSKSLMKISTVQTITIETLTYAIVVLFLCAVDGQDAAEKWDVVISFPTAIMFIRKEALYISRGYMQLASTESAVSYIHIGRESQQPQKAEWNGAVEEVAFSGVRFAYHDGMPILIGASFRIIADGINVLTGPSGIGKTTTIDLIAGLRKPLEGSVIYNHSDIAHYSPQSVLKKVAIVEQEPVLFEGSYLDNIALGYDVDRQEILLYTHALGLDKHISTETDLYKTVSRSLSTGEKQRIAFIRALVKHPDVFLLDEVTSNVDELTSNIMISYLRTMATEKIVLCITHDPNVIHSATHAFELANNKIVRMS